MSLLISKYEICKMLYLGKEPNIGLYIFPLNLQDVISDINNFFSLHFSKTWQQEANIGLYIFCHNKLARVTRLHIFFFKLYIFFLYNFCSACYRTSPNQRPMWLILAKFLLYDQIMPKTLQFSLHFFVTTFMFSL